MTSFVSTFENSSIVLTTGPLLERLKREFLIDVDHEELSHSELIYTHPDLLESLFRQYLDIGRSHNLPILVLTLTTRMTPEAMSLSKYGHLDMTDDACKFMNTLKQSYEGYSNKVFIGGAMGCKGDAYSGESLLSVDEAYEFHSVQAKAFLNKPVDFLYANIMPEINEVTGMAKAMSETGLPYIISFMIRKNGRLLDGTSIADAIKFIDGQEFPRPLCYMTNCIHPTNLRLALDNPANKNRPELKRFKGIKSNASSLSPEELDDCPVMHREDFSIMVDDMEFLHQNYDLKILGGCCGTDDKFLNKLSEKLRAITPLS
jgi:S-methylmethionine-dependent homocysteine/selenocysteine methylase